VVIGHLPARPEPGRWASPGPSNSTETHRKPLAQVTLCNQQENGRQAEGYSIPPNRRLRTVGRERHVRRTYCPFQRASAGLDRVRPASGPTSRRRFCHKKPSTSGLHDPAGSLAAAAVYQRGEQAWPLRPVVPALGRGGWRPDGGPYGLVRAAARPCGTAAWPVVTGGTGFSTRHPPRRCGVITLAGWAHQPVQGVFCPACSDCPSPVVCLPERGRSRESGPASRHGAPGGRYPDLVTNDTVSGDRDRMSQRVEPHRSMRGITITVSRDADGRRLSSVASPPGHAQPPGVSGETS
jgi:hypothetical protein